MKAMWCVLVFLLLAVLTGCTSNTYEFTGQETATVVQQDGKIYIQDRQGKLWDVTYGVENLGFFAESFERGSGEDRFIPITDPQFMVPGDPGYWSPDDQRRVIALSINGEDRAYPTEFLGGIEICDDVFPGEGGDSLYLAVGW